MLEWKIKAQPKWAIVFTLYPIIALFRICKRWRKLKEKKETVEEEKIRERKRERSRERSREREKERERERDR